MGAVLNMQLYKIRDEYLKALDDLSADEILTPEIIEDSLSLIVEDFDKKALNIAAYIKNLEADLTSIENYQDEMDKRFQQIRSKVNNLKEYLKFNMESCKRDKIEGVEFNVSLRNAPCSLIVDDTSKLDKKWFVTKMEERLDKESIKEALKSGERIEGVYLNQSKYIVIK